MKAKTANSKLLGKKSCFFSRFSLRQLGPCVCLCIHMRVCAPPPIPSPISSFSNPISQKDVGKQHLYWQLWVLLYHDSAKNDHFLERRRQSGSPSTWWESTRQAQLTAALELSTWVRPFLSHNSLQGNVDLLEAMQNLPVRFAWGNGSSKWIPDEVRNGHSESMAWSYPAHALADKGSLLDTWVFPKHERGSWGCLLRNVAQNSGWDRLLVFFSVIVTSGQVPTWQISDVFPARWYHPAFHKQGELSHSLKARSAPNLGGKDWLSQMLWREQENTW